MANKIIEDLDNPTSKEIQHYNFLYLVEYLLKKHSLSSLQFKVAPGFQFPEREVLRVLKNNDAGKIEITVSFMGLVGQSGVLPKHITSTLLLAASQKNEAMTVFFDFFHHHLLTLLYKVSKGEHTIKQQQKLIIASSCNKQHQPRALPDEQLILAYVPYFNIKNRPQKNLVHMLTKHFKLPFTIKSLSEKSAHLQNWQRTKLTNMKNHYQQLDVNCMIRTLASLTNHHFSITICSIHFNNYLSFLPRKKSRLILKKLISLYIQTALTSLSASISETQKCL